MSFVLPGNARELRFSGEAKAFTDEPSRAGGSVALGKPRVRKPTAPPPVLAVLASPMTSRGGQRNTGATAASPGKRISTPVPSYGPVYGDASIRQKAQSPHEIDDEMATMALDREAYDIMPGGMNNELRPTSPPRAPSPRGSAAPIPHFRPAHAAAQTVVVPSNSTDVRAGRGAPLALWIFAAVLAGILSYHVTPAVMSHFESLPPARAGG
jgi:hypothetical protein